MAATNPSLAALTAAALALPGMTPPAEAGAPYENVEMAFQYSHYQESQDRVHVDVYHGAFRAPVTGRVDLGANWIEDTWGGASPVLSVPASTPLVLSGASTLTIAKNDQPITDKRPVQIMSSASPHETRRQQDFRAAYYFDDVAVELAGGQSNEPDWNSDLYRAETLWDVNQKMTTLTLGFGFVTNNIHPTTRDIRKHNSERAVQLGLTHILDKQSLIQAGLSFTDATGFLSHPYKKVFIQNVGVIFDARPDHRQQWAFTSSYLRHFDFSDAALQLDYRFYSDDWGIRAHTFEAAWRQPVGGGWMVTPRIRYHSQNEADFFAPYFLGLNSSGNYTSDYRLSGFGAISGGVSLGKRWFDRLSLDVGFEYYEHRSALQLGGATVSSYADVSFYLVNAALKFEF